MAGISGSGDGNGRRKPTNIPLSKRPRVSTPKSNTQGRSAAGPRSQIEPETDPTSSGSSPESEDESDTESSLSRSSSSGSDDEPDREPEETAPADSNIIINGASVTLTDPSILDCPICHGPLIPPVYQCEDGHISCVTCFTQMWNKCPRPSCGRPIGTIHCRALENLLDSVKFSCRNALYGCTETYSLKKLLFHDMSCSRYPCTCPYNNCNFIGIESLYKHFGEVHSPSVFSFNAMKSISLDYVRTEVFLQDSSQSTLFIVKRVVKSRGIFVIVAFIGPDSRESDFSYDLTAVIDRNTYVKIKADVECVRKVRSGSVLRKCLLVPMDLLNGTDELKLELIIRRNPVSAS